MLSDVQYGHQHKLHSTNTVNSEVQRTLAQPNDQKRLNVSHLNVRAKNI